MTWVIVINEDETELGLFRQVDWAKGDPHVTTDVDDRPMTVAKTFDADTWEEAKAVYQEWLDTRLN